MLQSNGEIGDPCGVPDSMSEYTPPSMIPARSQLRSSFNIARSETRRSIRAISASWSISSKQLLMSASSTQCAPEFALWRMTSSAS